MRVIFHGAAGEVTGSCHEVQTQAGSFLLDCGLIQGSRKDEARNREPFTFRADKIEAVVLSHAHLDHCGRLPLLVDRGFAGPIWMQAATAELLPVMLEDAARLAEADAERARRKGRREESEPVFTLKQVKQVLRQIKALPYNKTEEIAPGVRIRFVDAGHILGSSSVWFEADDKVLVFSGDIGPNGTPILRDSDPPEHADLVLLESTYGDHLHRTRTATIAELGQILEQAWEEGGNVLIPAFAVGRSQEILYWFARHWQQWNLSRWKIFLDSPMAIKVVDVYASYVHLFDEEARETWSKFPNPFRLPNLVLSEAVDQSRAINEHRSGAIIIAGAGMCTGGRIVHHLRQNLGRKNAHVVIVGYQAFGTLGRRLVNREPTVRMFGEDIQVNAAIHTLGGMSAHADQTGLMAWYENFSDRPPIALVHGEDDARVELSKLFRQKYDVHVTLSKPGMALDV